MNLPCPSSASVSNLGEATCWRSYLLEYELDIHGGTDGEAQGRDDPEDHWARKITPKRRKASKLPASIRKRTVLNSEHQIAFSTRLRKCISSLLRRLTVPNVDLSVEELKILHNPLRHTSRPARAAFRTVNVGRYTSGYAVS